MKFLKHKSVGRTALHYHFVLSLQAQAVVLITSVP